MRTSNVALFLPQRVRSRSLEDVVILNVDTNTLESPFDDLHNLPSDVVRRTLHHTHKRMARKLKRTHIQKLVRVRSVPPPHH